MSPARRIRVDGRDLTPGAPVILVLGDSAVMLWALRSERGRRLCDDKRDADRYLDAELAGRGWALAGAVEHRVHHGILPWVESRVRVRPRTAGVLA